MKKAPQGWLVFTRKKVAGFHPQNDNPNHISEAVQYRTQDRNKCVNAAAANPASKAVTIESVRND